MICFWRSLWMEEPFSWDYALKSEIWKQTSASHVMLEGLFLAIQHWAVNFTFNLPAEFSPLFPFCVLLCSCKWDAIVGSAEAALSFGSADWLLPLSSPSSCRRWWPALLSDFDSPCIGSREAGDVVADVFQAVSGTVNAGGSSDSHSSYEEGQTSSTKSPFVFNASGNTLTFGGGIFSSSLITKWLN